MTFNCGIALDASLPPHTHEKINEMGPWCAVAAGAVTASDPAPVPQPAPGVNGPHAGAGALWEATTGPQRDYVATLGGDPRAAALLGKRGASGYIDVLLGKKTLEQAIEKFTGKQVRTAPISAPEPVAEPVVRQAPTGIPPEMIALIKDGYYATRADEKSPYLFYKMSRPTNGQYKGAVKLSTRHGDDWKVAWVLYPSGREYVMRSGIKEHLLELIANQDKAKHRYARELGSCCICGRALTDERSRYYGIGPDCEERHQAQILWVEDTYGPYAPGRGFSTTTDR